MDSRTWIFYRNRLGGYFSDTCEMMDGGNVAIKYTHGNSHIDIAVLGCDQLMALEDGFISLGSTDDRWKIYCEYDFTENLYRYVAWFVLDGEISGFCGVATDSSFRSLHRPKNSMKDWFSNPSRISKFIPKDLRNYFRDVCLESKKLTDMEFLEENL